MKRFTHVIVAATVFAFTAAAHAGVLMEWDASDWTGVGAWTDTAAGEDLNVAIGTVTQTVDAASFAGTGQTITSTVYNGASGFNSDALTPLAGLDEFTISAVIRVGATPGAAAGPDNQPWRYAMVTGFELPGSGQGEFQFGFSSANTLNGAVGFNGDQFSTGGSVAANDWATVAMTVDNDGGGNFTIQTYINGVAQGSPTTAAYAGAHPDVRDAIFGVGWNTVAAAGADQRFFTGEIAHLRFDDTVLSGSELNADAANYLGTIEGDPTLPTATALWKASDYTSGNWVDQIGGIEATPGGAPIANAADGVYFDGVDDQFSVAPGDNPIAGLSDFTVSAIFEADGTLGEGGENRSNIPGDDGRFWMVSHLVGNEQAGGGAGDWGIGIDGTQNIQSGVGLQGDQTIEVTDDAPYNDGQRHIVTMVMDDDANELRIFIDGVLEATLAVTPNTVVDEGFFFGTNGAPAAGDRAFFNGHLIEIAFHDRSLANSEVLALHGAGSFMAMQVPAPAALPAGLILLTTLAARRRRA